MATSINKAGKVHAEGNAKVQVGDTLTIEGVQNHAGGVNQVQMFGGNGASHILQNSNFFNIGDLRSTRDEKINKFLSALYKSPYEDRKERNPDRVPGTCEWFVSHQLFRQWQEVKSSPTLWVSADPGCGKSVLVKYLVDSVLQTTETKTVCYFFFKDDFEDQKNATNALCCILYQIFKMKRVLVTDAILDEFNIRGENFTSSFTELWKTLVNVAKDSNAGEITCLLDAIDECENRGFELAQALNKLYDTEKDFNLKFLITSRPYGEIRRRFLPSNRPEMPVIHLSGESESEMDKISQEIDAFIGARVQDIGAQHRLAKSEKRLLLERLTEVPNRTYLWVHLTLDLIQNYDDINQTGIVNLTTRLPTTVDEAYDRILSKSNNPEKAKTILQIIVAAERPLTLREMALALAVKENDQSNDEFHVDSEERFRERIRNICGLLVTIINSRIYLLHQTVKEFLVENVTGNSLENFHGGMLWKGALQLQDSHLMLAEICIRYLLRQEFGTHPLHMDGSIPQYVERHMLLDYCAKHWTAHLRKLQIKTQIPMTQTILKVCDANSKRCLTWLRVYWTSTNTNFPERFTTLMVVSYFGLITAVRQLLEMGDIHLNDRDYTFGRSPLSWAAGNGFDTVVKDLLKGSRICLMDFKLPFRRRADTDSLDNHGRTPLSYAVWSGKVVIVRMLLEAGARASLRDNIGGTPLSYAVCNGHEDIIALLLKKGAQTEEENIREELLLAAAREGHEPVVQLVLDTGKVDVNAKNSNGDTALLLASESGYNQIIQLLLDTSKVDLNATNRYSWTALSRAASLGYEKIVRLLIETSQVDLNIMDKEGWAALSFATSRGHEKIVQLLIETGQVDINAMDKDRRTALSRAASLGHEKIVQLLIETGQVDLNIMDKDGETALSRAASLGHEKIVRLLIETGQVDITAMDKDGWTALSYAAFQGHEKIVQLLIETGQVDLNIMDKDGKTALSFAASLGHEKIVQLLIETGLVGLNVMDKEGRTALDQAVRRGHKEVAEILLRY